MLSVIIPLGPKDGNPETVLSELAGLPEDSEIIFAVAQGAGVDTPLPANARIVEGSPGRAAQMNEAARAARGEFLWFLHADSKLAAGAIFKLLEAVKTNGPALFYHDLAFMKDGPWLMWLNSLAVKFRSDVLKIPFGDQGFCISKALFFELGAYDESASYGEDHLLVWTARQSGVSLQRTGGEIYTSARKYQAGGWGKITGLHVWLTIKQAAPEFIKLLRGK